MPAASIPYKYAVGHNLRVTYDAHELQQAFAEAEFHADISALRALLADDFRSIGDQGYLLDKAQWLGKFVGRPGRGGVAAGGALPGVSGGKRRRAAIPGLQRVIWLLGG